MACSVCGSNANCGCVDPALPCCGSGSRVTQGGCCSPVVQQVPMPFYACAPSCPESHVRNVTIQAFSADVKIVDSWNIPLCGTSAVVNTESLRAIVTGSFLWNPDYGYFQVGAFNAGTGQVTLVNTCHAGNAAAGTNVPSCTEFTVTVPPCDCGSDQQVCVAIDFTAPVNSACLDITLTSTLGLAVADTVGIGTGFYFLEAIKPNDIVTICNHGEGITPGTSVIAQDVNGNYQYCLSIISTNPCDRDAEDQIVMLGCGNDGVTVPLNGSTVGWIPTLLDAATNEVAFRPLGTSNECSTLAADFHILNTVPNYSNVLVTSSSEFAVDDILVIDSIPGYTFTVTGVPDGTHLNLSIFPSPTFDFTASSGLLICLVSCCDNLMHFVQNLITSVQGIASVGNAASFLDSTPVSLTIGSPTFSTAHHTVTITNPSATRSMKVYANFQFTAQGGLDFDTDDFAAMQITINYKINGGSTQSPEITMTNTNVSDSAYSQDYQQFETRVDTIAPSGTLTYEIWGQLDLTLQTGPTAYDMTDNHISYSYTGSTV